MNAFFVTGTDTSIGKTAVTAGLTWLSARSGLRSVAVKPVAAGQELFNGIWVNSDVQQLLGATNLAVTEAQVDPIQFRQACAPHMRHSWKTVPSTGWRCSMRCGGHLRSQMLASSRASVASVFRSLSSSWDTADMARELRLPVLLVVGMRLGCLNHALLKAEAIRARGLQLAGLPIPLTPPCLTSRKTLTPLTFGLRSPCWGLVPRLHAPSPRAVAEHLQLEALRSAMQENFV